MQLALTASSPNEEAKKRLTRKITLGPVQFPTVGNFYYWIWNFTPHLAAGKAHIILIYNSTRAQTDEPVDANRVDIGRFWSTRTTAISFCHMVANSYDMDHVNSG